MKDYFIGYIDVDFSFNLNFSVSNSSSGFLFQIGQTGDNFYPVISFSGYSGYVFDQVGSMVGGYIKDAPISISGNYFKNSREQSSTGRFSFFLNNDLIANNIKPTGFVDCVRLEKYSDEISAFIYQINTGDYNMLHTNSGAYLISSDGYYLVAKD